MPEPTAPENADPAESSHAGWPDRSRDLIGWLLTPLITIVVAPVMTGVVTVVLVLSDNFTKPPTLCRSAVVDNTCEETTLGTFAGHIVFFAMVWLLLWLLPWWRGLRTLRVVLAVMAAVVLIAVPIRMAA